MSKKSNRQPQPPKLNPLTEAAQAQAGAAFPRVGTRYDIHVERTESKTIFDPDIVRAYASMVPDAPERILVQFELNGDAARASQKAQDDRQELAIFKQAKDNERRDWMAFALLAFMMVLSGVFAWLGHSWLATGALVGLAGYVAVGFFKWRK